MNSHIYRQYDNRWRWLPYPSGGYYLNGSGCGCCAVTHCIIEMNKYKNWTPANVQPYMKQFAIRGNGTRWAGITQSLQHYGLKDVQNVPSMSQVWKILAKGNYIGVILFGNSKGPDGTVWTTGGHYIAFTDYRIKNGQHQFYLKDSGGRKHDGWYSYERSMKGDVRQIWVARVPSGSEIINQFADSLKKKDYTGNLPTGTISTKKGSATNIKRWQKFLNWWYDFKLTVDGDFGNATASATQDFQEAHGLSADGIVGANTLAKAKTYLAKKKVTDSTQQNKTQSTTSKTTTTTKTTTKTTAKTTNSRAILISKIMKACKAQSVYMKNATYSWESSPTIAKSKKKGTCVTYVACVLQRLGYLKSGKYIWHTGKGYGTGKVYGTNSKMTVTYMKNKSLSSLKDKLKRGDIILLDDNKSGQEGSGGHILILTGRWTSSGNPYVWDNETAKKGQKARVYNGKRKVLARVRLK